MQCVFPCVAVAESSTLAPVTSVNVSPTGAAYVDDQVVTTEGNADCELETDSMQSSFGSDSDGDGGDDGNDGDGDDSSEFVPSEDSDGEAESGSDPVRDRKFIVFEENLNELLERCRRCGEVSYGTHGQICWSKFAVYANGQWLFTMTITSISWQESHTQK